MGASLAPDFQSPTRARAETEAKRPPDFECCFLQSSSSPGADARGQLTELRQGFEMTDKFKKRVREHAKKSGMNYQAALQQLSAGEANMVMVSCPFHEDKTPSMGVSPNGKFYCFACEARGSTTDPSKPECFVQDPSTLYKLPPPDEDKAVESADEALSAWMGYARKLEKGHSPPGKKGPKTIIVNGREHETEVGELSYEDVLELAYPGIDPTRILSVAVSYRDRRDKILIPGKSVRVEPKMVISAYDTSNA